METHRDLNATLGEGMGTPTYRQDMDIQEDDFEDKKLLRKLDWHILPPLSLLYLLCYLDRT